MHRSPYALGVAAALGLSAQAAARSPVLAGDRTQRPRIDVVFTLDTTGSMGDEIDVVKAKIWDIANQIASGRPQPDVRFGIVAYRDRGDVYAVRTTTLTRDLDAVRRDLMGLEADGGADEPEDVQAALREAVTRMNWDLRSGVARMVFLVGDAGSHGYRDLPPTEFTARAAQEKRIVVNAVGCSGLSAMAEQEYRRIARITGGSFEQLTYSHVETYADGSRRTVLRRGSDVYEADRELGDLEWKAGADTLAARGDVRAAPPAGAGGLGFARRTVTSFDDDAVTGELAAPATTAPALISEQNNLDAVITSKIRAAAQAAGVEY